MQEREDDSSSISYKALFKIIWKEKILFFLIPIVVGGLGLWYAFSLQEEFTANGRILPELQSKGGKFGGLQGLASLAGLDLGNIEGTEAIRPDLYPDVLKSTPFFLELFKQTVTTRDNKQISFENFYHSVVEQGREIPEKYTKKFPVKENGFLVLNPVNETRIENLKKRIQVGIDKKSGIINISVKMPDPVVAAGVARFSMIYLTEYVTRYRIDKAKKDLSFLEEKVDAARGKFYSTQTKKAQYSDQFQLPTMRLQSADIQRERLESEYRMSSAFYNELLKKYEEAKIKVQQETPVFQVLEPPVVPTKKSEPKKASILLVALFLGGILGILVILVKNKNYKQVIVSPKQ